jgi:hypothetical protein
MFSDGGAGSAAAVGPARTAQIINRIEPRRHKGGKVLNKDFMECMDSCFLGVFGLRVLCVFAVIK